MFNRVAGNIASNLASNVIRSGAKRLFKKRRPLKLKKKRVGNNAIKGPAVLKSRIPGGFPDIYRLPFRYNSVIRFSSVLNIQVYNANSIYDPDLTNSGHQPLYYDQFSPIYNKYQVDAFKLEIEITNQSSTTNSNCLVGISNFDPSTTVFDVLDELPYTKRASVGPSTGMNTRKLSIYGTVKRIYGLKNIEQEDSLASGYSTNPTYKIYVWFCSIATDGSSSQNIYFRGTLTQYTKLYDRKIVALSYALGPAGSTGGTHTPSSGTEVVY